MFVGGCSTADSTTGSASNSQTESDSVVTVGGSLEAYEYVERLADAYQTKTGTTFEFFPPSQTSSGVEGVKSSMFDVGGMSRKPTAADSSDMTYIPLTVAPLVIVVHDSVVGVEDIR